MRNVLIDRCVLALLGSVGAVTMISGASLIDGSMTPALTQVESRNSVDLRAALDPHGRWQRHPRWGEVWLPVDRRRDWRPYMLGHWAYTDEWGWYWISAQDEEDWGWVAFHYGRWVSDPDFGWMWIPGNQWGPGWVDWRRGGQRVGWAPLPPDEILAEVEERPQAWIFVRDRDFAAPQIADVILAPDEYDAFIRETVVVNRTIMEERERIAINPGIEPEFIAAAVGRPLVPVEVRPPVLPGTVGVANGVEIRTAERQHPQVAVTEKRQASIQPAPNIPSPTPLRAGEKGRLGGHPPTGAREAQQPGTAASVPAQQHPQGPGGSAAPGREHPGAQGAVQRPQLPQAPSKMGQPPQLGTPSAAQERNRPGRVERQTPSGEHEPGTAQKERGQVRTQQRSQPPAISRGQPKEHGVVAPPEREARPHQRQVPSSLGDRGPAKERAGSPSRADQRRGPSAQQSGGRAEERHGPSAAEQRGARPPAAEKRGSATRPQAGAVQEQRPTSSMQSRGQQRHGPGMGEAPRGGAGEPSAGARPQGGESRSSPGQSHGPGRGERQQ